MNRELVYRSIKTAAGTDFSRSGGPGGQNVNKVNTKVTLRMRVSDIEGLNEAELIHMKNALAARINNEDEIVIHSAEERSQRANLERAYMRLFALVCAAGRLPKIRKKTKPSRAAKEARLRAKHYQSAKKAVRAASSEEN